MVLIYSCNKNCPDAVVSCTHPLARTWQLNCPLHPLYCPPVCLLLCLFIQQTSEFCCLVEFWLYPLTPLQDSHVTFHLLFSHHLMTHSSMCEPTLLKALYLWWYENNGFNPTTLWWLQKFSATDGLDPTNLEESSDAFLQHNELSFDTRALLWHIPRCLGSEKGRSVRHSYCRVGRNSGGRSTIMAKEIGPTWCRRLMSPHYKGSQPWLCSIFSTYQRNQIFGLPLYKTNLSSWLTVVSHTVGTCWSKHLKEILLFITAAFITNLNALNSFYEPKPILQSVSDYQIKMFIGLRSGGGDLVT